MRCWRKDGKSFFSLPETSHPKGFQASADNVITRLRRLGRQCRHLQLTKNCQPLAIVQPKGASNFCMRKLLVGQILYTSHKQGAPGLIQCFQGLATHLFKEPIKEPLRFIKIVLSNVDYRGEVFKCYVQVDNPGREPKMYSSGNETQSTREEALEVLRVALVKKIAAKHEEITARDKEVAARDKKKEQEWEVGRRRFNNATREETHDKYESPYS